MPCAQIDGESGTSCTTTTARAASRINSNGFAVLGKGSSLLATAQAMIPRPSSCRTMFCHTPWALPPRIRQASKYAGATKLFAVLGTGRHFRECQAGKRNIALLRHFGRGSGELQPLRGASRRHLELPSARGRGVKRNGRQWLWRLVAPQGPGERARARWIALQPKRQPVGTRREGQKLA